MSKKRAQPKERKVTGGWVCATERGECCQLPTLDRKAPYGLWYVCPSRHHWQWWPAKKGGAFYPDATELARADPIA